MRKNEEDEKKVDGEIVAALTRLTDFLQHSI